MRTAQDTRGWLRLPLLAALLALIAVVAIACGGDDDDDEDDGGDTTPPAGQTEPAGGTGKTITVKAGETIKIGLSTTLTTDNAELGLPIQAASQFAIDEKGTIKGFDIELVSQDDLCSAPGSTAAAEALVAENIVAVLGPMCSSGTVAALPTYQEWGGLVMSGSATGVAVTQQGAENFFRTAWNDATQGAGMAEYAFTTLGLTKAVLVDDQSVYGKGLMDVFEDSFTELGGEVLSRESVTVGEKDFSPVVTKIEEQDPEIVVFGGFIAEGAVLVSQMRSAGVETAAFMGADGIADADWIAQSQGAAENAYVSRGPVPSDNAAYEAFSTAYQAALNEEPGQFGEHYYDAANIIMAAIEKVSTTNADGDLVIDVDALIEEIGATNYAGASGQIQFNEVGDRVIAAGVVNRIDQVKSGVFERIQ